MLGFKHKFTYFLRTVLDIADYLFPIEETLRSRFTPAITGVHICSDAERALLVLAVKFGHLGLQNLCEAANIELLNSKEITKELYENVITEDKDFQIDSEKKKTIKNELKRRKILNYKTKLEELRNSMNEKMKRCNDISHETGSSNWLSAIPMREFNYVLNKQQFWDSIRLRHGWPIPGLPVSCSCEEGFNVQHAMSCKKGGFVAVRHNEVRDITATLFSDVCKDVELESFLLTLNGVEQTMRKTAKTNDEVRLDICATSFWVSGQKEFFNIRLFDPNARRNSQQTLKQCYSMNGNEKKRHYNTRIMKMNQGSFTPLVFTVAGGNGGEGGAFDSRLTTLLSLKNGIEKAKVTSWIRSKVNSALLRSMLLCLRGSRQKLVNEKLDIELEHTSIKNN